MRLTIRITTLFAAVLTLLCASAQEKATPIATEANQTYYRMTHYDDHNGMSQWHATKILQDKYGFMWFATWNGLNRYDGYDFAVFKSKPGDGNSLASDRIRNMILGEDGNIYCSFIDRVWRFNISTYKFEDVSKEEQERYLARINSDTSVKTDPEKRNVCGFDIENVRQVFTDAQKNTWVMGAYGVEKISPAPPPAKMLSSVPMDIIRYIFPDKKERIWITSRNKKIVTVLDKDANLIGYLGKDGRLHKEQTEFYPIYCVFQQKNGTLWMGSKPDGVFRLKESADGVFAIEHFTQGSTAEIQAGKTISRNDIYAFAEDNKGRLWIGTQGAGVMLVENPNADAPAFRNIYNTFTSFPKSSYSIRRLLVKDDLLLCTTTEGFIVATGINGDPKNVKFNLHMREPNRASSLSCSATMDMVIDRKGRLFISTESGGVNMLLTQDLTAKSFDFKRFDTDNGMGSDVADAMTEVGDEILVQCNNQVTRINADMNSVENFNELFFNFPTRFSDAEPLLLKNGQWLLSLETGVYSLPEQAFHKRSYVPRIVLTAFDIPGKYIDYTADTKDTLVLSSKERDVTITYAALDYTDNSHIKYITRITSENGWFADSDSIEWSTPKESRTTSLYNLDPGTYTLEIRSTNAEGLWVDNVRKLTIIVEPAFWETTLAYIIYILLAILLVSGATYMVVYIRNLKRQREENLQAYLKLFEEHTTPQPIAETKPADAEPEAVTEEQPVEEPASEGFNGVVIASHMSEEDDAFMRRLLAFVDENIGDSNVGVDEMASATATSRSSLNRKMKSLLGVTPADFLKEARMKRACQQLIDTKHNVNDIAYSCGFSDPKYFSKCFKASMGMSPSEYRARK